MTTNVINKGWFNPISLSVLLVLIFLSVVLHSLHIVNMPVLLFLILISSLLALSIRVADQWERAVVLRMGKFKGLKGPGPFMIIPILDSVSAYIDQRVRVSAFKAEQTLTKDTVPVNVDAVVYWTVWDVEKAALEVQEYQKAIEHIAQTGLRDTIGKHELSTLLQERDKIAEDLQHVLDRNTNPWGITCQTVGINDIAIPQDLADAMRVIHAEDECNDTYGRIRMYQALLLKNPTGIKIPSERTVYRVMDEIGLVHRSKRKPNGITKADREARKSDDLLKREFKADKPLEKCVTDITEIKAKDGKLYVSAIFDCFDSSVLGLAMETNMKATLCEHTLDNAYLAHPDLRGAIVHSDRGRQYTSETYRQALSKYGIIQSMNSAGGRCHDNARCESMWARMKSELLYDRYNTESLTTDELRVLIWRYFISYWNNRRICSANGGLPPMIKRQRYYQSLGLAA